MKLLSTLEFPLRHKKNRSRHKHVNVNEAWHWGFSAAPPRTEARRQCQRVDPWIQVFNVDKDCQELARGKHS